MNKKGHFLHSCSLPSAILPVSSFDSLPKPTEPSCDCPSHLLTPSAGCSRVSSDLFVGAESIAYACGWHRSSYSTLGSERQYAALYSCGTDAHLLRGPVHFLIVFSKNNLLHHLPTGEHKRCRLQENRQKSKQIQSSAVELHQHPTFPKALNIPRNIHKHHFIELYTRLFKYKFPVFSCF